MNRLIFLHGPSGSGKGELAKILISNLQSLDYQVFYGASGDFFRAAMANNPQLASEMNSGKYIDSLYPIKDEIKKTVTEWQVTGDKGVLILDGVIRRIAFDNIPHQIDQMAEFLDMTHDQILAATHIAVNAHPDDLYAQIAARNSGRSDDHEAGIRKRMANWTDFARQSVLDLGYVMNAQGELSSSKPNLLTITNGAHYGIGLEEFKERCNKLIQKFNLR